MDNEQGAILSALLDKYEKSVQFTESRTVARKVALHLCNDGRNDFPLYNIENYEARVAYNRAAEELKSAGLVDYEWMKGQRGHLIARVWLNIADVQRAYVFVDRVPKADMLDAVETVLVDTLANVQLEWQRDYLNDCLALVCSRKSTSKFLPQELTELKELVLVLEATNTTNTDEVLERVFSTKVLGNSKLFEKKYRSWLIKIVCNYLLNGLEDVSDDEALAQVGIIRYPEEILFCGGLKVKFADGIVDYSPIPCSTSMSISALLLAKLAVTAQRILLIENKANYIHYLAHHKKKGELVVFHGGCYSPLKERLLRIVAAESMDAQVYHWGDIDWGGFTMLSRLRKNIFPKLIPYRMDEQELCRYANGTIQITDMCYRQRLKKLLEDVVLADCRPCILHMLKHNVKLEQEIMIY